MSADDIWKSRHCPDLLYKNETTKPYADAYDQLHPALRGVLVAAVLAVTSSVGIVAAMNADTGETHHVEASELDAHGHDDHEAHVEEPTSHEGSSH
ncbi:hypothetical protein HOD30_00390 [Candidatus Peregrinibacteria bacterium]|jgi:hypothetical protein|nr:hypothetical protein [Candidatus Peregrinibacteria bacterium]MBT4631999.1 hypothetical protein [Candidatus Peregrinibacteria bacterium]MBT5823798.1 hypothetical protein [Candidatus Peregrinibacteria bacterium]